MKIPETAGCEPARPPSQMAAIPLSPPSNKKQSDLRSEKQKEEIDNVNDTFKKLMISPNIDEKSTDTFTTVKRLETDRIIYSHSGSHSSTSSDSDDELVPKCPERESKNRQNRQQCGPYTGHFSNRYHHCGGAVTYNNNYYNNGYYDQIPQNLPVQQNNLDQEYDGSEKAVNEFMNIITNKQWQTIVDAMNILKNCLDSKPDESETVVSEDAETVSRNDDDSAYETSSPNSSISFSPMPNLRYSDVEGSPLHENESVTNAFIPEFEAQNSNQNIFKTPSSTGKKERTQPVHIPSGRPLINRSHPATSKSVPTSPVQQRKQCPPSIAIAPESTVYESPMTQLGAERLKPTLNQRRLGIEWIIVLQDNSFTTLDSNSNQTKLMLHLRNQSRPFYNEVFHAMLERIKKEQLLEILCHESSIGENALSIAVNELPDKPIIARCIVDALTSMSYIVDQVDGNGNSLIHKLASYGDKHLHVLAELLNARRENNSPCFDVNKQNIMQETPLHISTKRHSQQFSTLAVTKLLVKHNANISTKDSEGRTPVHLAVKHSSNPLLLKALLASNYTISASVSVDHLGDTALHYAGARNDLDLNHQLEIMNQLVRSQWKLNAVNSDNKTPLAYLSEQRRKIIKDHLTKK